MDNSTIYDSCEYVKTYVADNDIFTDEIRQHIWYIIDAANKYVKIKEALK